MLYPAELQALPQPRGVTVAQGFSLCLARDAEELQLSRSFGQSVYLVERNNETTE